MVDKGYRGHNHEKFRVWISGQVGLRYRDVEFVAALMLDNRPLVQVAVLVRIAKCGLELTAASLGRKPDMRLLCGLVQERAINSLDFDRRHAWLFSLAAMPHFGFKRLPLQSADTGTSRVERNGHTF